MIVYVESNFVLEIALEQEQSMEARAILAHAECGQIKLVFPSFVLSEPFECIMRERRERNNLHSSLLRTLNYLQRSEPHRSIMLDLEPVVSILRDAHRRQIDLLHSVFDRLLNVGECIAITIANFREASIYQRSLGLSPQYSIIYSAIISDLKLRPREEMKCFLSRDRKAFANEDDRSIKKELGINNCRYIGSFVEGWEYMRYITEKAE